MKFSYSETWDDAARMARADGSLLLAIAGVFLFLPAVLIGTLTVQPEPAATAPEMFENLEAYFNVNWHWVLLANIMNMMGAITIFLLLLGHEGKTVGQAILAALPILPLYFVASLLSGFIIGAGLMLLIVPGLYLFGRLAVLGPVVAAEDRHPIRAIRRSWALTKKRGWAVFGLILLVFFATYVVTFVVSVVLGLIFVVLLSDGMASFFNEIVSALGNAILSTILIVLYAAIYRRLASGSAASAVTNGI